MEEWGGERGGWFFAGGQQHIWDTKPRNQWDESYQTLEVDTEAQKLTKWFKESASRSARILKEIHVRNPPPSPLQHCSLGASVPPPFAKSSSRPFVFLPEQQSVSQRGPGGGPRSRRGRGRESRQALRALATSVKTRRLGLCVVPCEVVRVCGGHVTVSYADTRPWAAGNRRRSEPTPCWVYLKELLEAKTRQPWHWDTVLASAVCPNQKLSPFFFLPFPFSGTAGISVGSKPFCSL